MNAEKQKILEMLQDGKISAAEATQLLDALEDKPHTSTVNVTSGGKKLRVKVDGNIEDDQKIKVDVAVPMALGRMVDSILESCIPTAAREAMEEQGIDISGIKLGEILDTMESLDEDIVSADIDHEDTKMKVRIYVG